MDETVAKINKIIARLLGKKNNQTKPKLPDKIDNEFVNMVIICLCFLLVWSLTGLYYVEDGYTAIVQHLDNKKKVVIGGSFGFTLPFPFTKIEKIYTNPIEHLPLGDFDQSSYELINEKLQHIIIDGDFSYIVKSPLLLSNNLVLNHDKLNNLVRMLIKSELLNYSGYYIDNASINFGIIATNIKLKVNQLISRYGLELLLLNIKNVKLKQAHNIDIYRSNNESNLMNSSDFRSVDREVSR